MRALSYLVGVLLVVTMTSATLANDDGRMQILQYLLKAEECRIPIGPQTRAWIDDLLGSVSDKERAEARDWLYVLKDEPKVDYGQCNKFRAELFQDGWLG